ncbi:RIP metalloprotease RseP [Cochlodiniinecator piscidefendens]|uniref:RIP metalloprotease RseP n=1 Tax=Cochlodiniinecator piscidefendens TaxID=2715756 RepID=UPI00140CAE40|nr:RIP metalloprotease RseP [Cochlodiniinecator piscidefendens]
MDLTSFLPSFGGASFTIIAFVVALSIIVAVHEYGHYIVGRWSGIHAEVFSLGFGPVLFSRHDKRGTKWQIALLPFGGYVKFMGDANAASGKDGEAMEGLSETELRRTMHGAPLWARAATVAAGPVFNFILSFFVFAGVFLSQGVAVDPLTIASVRDYPVASQGLRVGDEVLSIAGVSIPDAESLTAVSETLPQQALLDYQVRRDGEDINVNAPHPFPPFASSIQPRSAAAEAGIIPGDVILSVDGADVETFEALRTIVGNSDGNTLSVSVWREGNIEALTMTPERRDLPLADGSFETRWLIGVTGGLFFDVQTETPGIGEALMGGVTQTWFVVKSSLSGLYHMATGAISSCNISGPIGIAQSAGDMASLGSQSFIWFIALLSTAVGLLNLFPIPVLDGGHLVFYAWEAVTGKPPNDKALQILMTIGLALLLSLMVFALTNDLFC